MHRFCIAVLFLVTTGRTATSFAWSRTAIDCSGHHRYACPPSSSTYADAVSELRAQLALQQEGCCGGSPGRGEHVTAPGNAEVCFEAYVSRRRPMGSGLAFLDLVDPTDEDAPELTALLKRQAFEPGSSADGAADPAAFAAYSKALQPGTLLRLVGTAAPTRTGEASLLVRRVTVLAAAPNPQHLYPLFTGARAGLLPRPEVAAALRLDLGELEVLLKTACPVAARAKPRRST
mmetsp:Transcript_8352/g.19031  ORF Transcript_8352/g.19031 Transcript_8352/m.19031 type:complete len:233 (-) Transcript_8352:50-748(-)